MAFIVFILTACNPETGILTISGKYLMSLDNNPKIGIFPAGISFSVITWNEVEYLDGSFAPIVVVVPDADGSYSIDFPQDLSTVGQLIAWYDYTDDDSFNMNDDEAGFFPVITVIETEYVITGWASIAGIFTAQDDSGNLLNLESIGTQGFDFFPSPVLIQ